MKTQFLTQLELIKAMALDNITERMSRCDVLQFDDNERGIYLGYTYKYFTHLKKDKEGVVLFDNDIFVARLNVLGINELCIVSDAIN